MSAKVPQKSAAKPGKDTIYIDVDDEITAIIDKVEAAKHNIVALVLPKRAAMLQSIVNMRLLKRSSTAAGKNVVLITNEHALLPLAGAAGLHVAKNLQSKPEIPQSPKHETPESNETTEDSAEELDNEPDKIDYNQPVGDLAAAHEAEDGESIDIDNEDSAKAAPTKAEAKKSKNKGLKVPNFDRFRLILLLGIGGLFAFIIFMIFAVSVLPKAKITIQTTSRDVSMNADYTASGTAKALDQNKKIIPAFLKTSDQTSSQQTTATGQKNLGEKASGSVTLKNCGDSAVTIPAGAGISSNGLTFITQKSVSLDSGNFTSGNVCKSSGGHVGSVNVTASTSGAKYNIGPSTFTVAGFSGVNATSSSAMSGGTDNNVTVVTQADVDKAKGKITSADSDKFSKDFQKQLESQGFYVVASTLKVGDAVATPSPAVGEEASSVSVAIKITYSVLVLQKGDIKIAVTDALNDQIDKKKEKISDNDVLNGLTITARDQQPNSPNATLELTKDTTAVPIIDEDAVKANAKGKKESQIKEYINTYPGVKNVDVKMSPFWVSHAPKKTNKITVVLQGVKQD